MMPGLSCLVGFAGSAGIAGSFSATVSPASINRTGGTSGTGSQTLTTSSVTVTPSGTSGTVTYAWSRVAGPPGITVNSPSAATTTFSATLAPDDEISATFQCLVTDASGATATVTVSVTITLVSYGRY